MECFISGLVKNRGRESTDDIVSRPRDGPCIPINGVLVMEHVGKGEEFSLKTNRRLVTKTPRRPPRPPYVESNLPKRREA
jgi:hypothetical protein